MKRSFESAILALIVLGITPSAAQAANSVNVQTFNPSTSDHFVFLEDGFRSEWPKTAKFYFGANYNYVNEPLVALNAAQTSKLFNVIDTIQTLDMFLGFKLTPKFGIFAGVPVHYINYPSTPGATGLPSGSASALGDMRLLGKIRLTEDTSNTAVALIPEFHFPTGSTENFLSDASAYGALRLAVERTFEAWTLNFNLGYASAQDAIYNSPTILQGIDYRNRLIFGLGAFKPFTDKWGMNLEFNSIHMIPFDKNLNPNDFYGGLRYVATDSLILTGGASLGKIGGPSGQNFRLVFGIRYTPYTEEEEPRHPAPVYVPPPPSPTPVPTPVPATTYVPTGSAPKAVLRAKRIEILSPINFEFDSDRLTMEGKLVLNDVADIINKNSKSLKKIMIDGHTDEDGTDQYNLKLSIARSKSVKNYLVSRKVPAKKLVARGFGERKPKVSESEPKAKEINRRVEFIVVK